MPSERPESTAWLIDDAIERFETTYRLNGRADIRDHLPPAAHPHFLTILCEIIRVDLEYGWEHGNPRSLEYYREHFPEVFRNERFEREILYEESRLRKQAGQPSTPIEAEVDEGNSTGSSAQNSPRLRRNLIPAGGTAGEVETLLHTRLRFIGSCCACVFTYFALLIIYNPTHKVGFSLEGWDIVVLNWLALAACVVLSAILWTARSLPLGQLRAIEAALFGLVLVYLGWCLFTDIFIDRELLPHLREGDHALFHYASSWSLPFFALIVSYGTLVPSTLRRCVIAVGAMALLPLALGVAGGLSEGAFTKSFVQSFLLQMALWIAAAAAIAVFGSHRLEALRQEASEARKLGQYQLKELLGTGGMGEVYLAEHVLLRRPCAIKVIRPERAGDPEVLRRFEREVRATATLTHPNTIQIFDYGLGEDGTFYYVMEYLPGSNLEQLVRRYGPLAPGRVIHILTQMAGALREAHAQGLIHRDIKPGNIIAVERGGLCDVAKLLDFGLVRMPGREGEGQSLVNQQLITGTPAFMSPEQAACAEGLDARTDIYSLGAVAYYLLTGRPPFTQGTPMQILAAHLHEPVVAIDLLRPDVPEGLQAVVMQCLEKDPDRRYSDAASLQKSLAACARD